MMRKGPLVTLAVAALLGAGLLTVNMSKETDAPAPAATASDAPPTEPAPSESKPSESAPSESTPSEAPVAGPQFPAVQDYVGDAERGGITVSITVEGDEAVAYVCDGAAVEAWLRGSAIDGTVDLVNDNGAALVGSLSGADISGNLVIPGDRPNAVTAAPVDSPSGIYVQNADGVRRSWIVDGDDVVGVERDARGNTAPAPELASGAVKVSGGDSDAF